MSYILILEDDPFIQLLSSRKLQGAGYQVRTTSDGDEALRLIRTDPPMIALFDIMLPAHNGLELCTQVKTELGSAAPPIVIVSARGDAADIEAAQEAGADDYLIKPFSPNELLGRVQAILNP